MPAKRPTDKQIFKQHRRRVLTPRPREADVEAAWQALSAAQKRAEPRRIRAAISAGTPIANVALPAGPVPPAPPLPPPPAPPLPPDDYDMSSGESDVGDIEPAATGIIVAAAPGPAAGADVDSDGDTPAERDQRIARELFGENTTPTFEGLTWQHARHCGSGTFGSAHLWVSGNGTNQIARRIVVKDAWVSDPNRWGSVKSWHGDPRDAAGRTPVEVYAMREMRTRIGADRVVGYHASSVDDSRMAYRILMPYYPHRPLDDIVTWYQSPPVRSIPEPFIWSVFEALTDACLVMENGTTRKMAAPPPTWQQIVHKDITLGNTFLDAPIAGDFPSYPRAVLGDFGSCILTQENDIMNPNHYADNMGSEGYMAPEQTNFINQASKELQLIDKLKGWTNVYGIGRTVQCLMKNEDYPLTGPLWQEGYVDPGPIFSAAEQNTYSQELRDLVKKCVRYTPSRRITARRLKGKILRRTGGAGAGGVDRAGGRRTGVIPQAHADYLEGWDQTDMYALGLAMPALPAADADDADDG